MYVWKYVCTLNSICMYIIVHYVYNMYICEYYCICSIAIVLHIMSCCCECVMECFDAAINWFKWECLRLSAQDLLQQLSFLFVLPQTKPLLRLQSIDSKQNLISHPVSYLIISYSFPFPFPSSVSIYAYAFAKQRHWLRQMCTEWCNRWGEGWRCPGYRKRQESGSAQF